MGFMEQKSWLELARFLDDVLGTSAIATNDVTFLRVIRLIQNLGTCT